MCESGSLSNLVRAARRLLLVLVLSSCATPDSPIFNKLDPVTATTIAFSGVPFIFYRDSPGRAAFARDYVYFGPIEVNRSGSYRYYLWLGIWSTMQHIDGPEPRDGFEKVFLFVDGELLSLEIAGWTPATISASEPVYVKPVASAVDAYYAVTVDQIRLIAEATDLRLISSGNDRKVFEMWGDQRSARTSLAEFLRESLH